MSHGDAAIAVLPADRPDFFDTFTVGETPTVSIFLYIWKENNIYNINRKE
jgi:hypothetical protein